MSRFKRRRIFLLLFGVFLILFVYLSFQAFGKPKERPLLYVSVIAHDQHNEHWTTIKKGIDQAAADYKVDVSFILLTNEGDAQEQCYLMDREYANGAQAIVIAPHEDSTVEEKIKELSSNIPIIAIKNNVAEDYLESFVAADNYKMGYALGEVMNDERQKEDRIMILTNSQTDSSMADRYSGLIEGLDTETFDINKFDSIALTRYTKQLYDAVQLGRINTVVALEVGTLEWALNTIEEYNLDVHLYGIGSVSNVAGYLSEGKITSMVAQNEFSIGYTGIEAAVKAIQKRRGKSDTNIQFRVVNQDNMYDEENEKLLFPLVD